MSKTKFTLNNYYNIENLIIFASLIVEKNRIRYRIILRNTNSHHIIYI